MEMAVHDHLLAAARIVAMQAARFWVMHFSLPISYWKLGMQIASDGTYRDEFPEIYLRLDAQAALIANLQTKPAGVARDRDFWQKGKSIAKTAINWMHVGAIKVNVVLAERRLGQAAFDKHGETCGLPGVIQQVLDRRAYIQNTAAQILQLQQGTSSETIAMYVGIFLGAIVIAGIAARLVSGTKDDFLMSFAVFEITAGVAILAIILWSAQGKIEREKLSKMSPAEQTMHLAKKQQKKPPVAIIVGAVVTLVVMITCSGVLSPTSQKTDNGNHKIGIGSEGRLTADTSGTHVVLAVDEDALHDLVSSNTREIAVMVLNGSCFDAPKGTHVKVLDWSGGAFKVLVLDGPAIGRTGLIPEEFVR